MLELGYSRRCIFETPVQQAYLNRGVPFLCTLSGCRGADALYKVVGAVFWLLAGIMCAGLCGTRAAVLRACACHAVPLDLDTFECLEHQN
jgi:hypothetical protein